MNYIDYINWANEYEDQVKILEKKLEKRKLKKFFETTEEKKIFESSTRILYEMKLDCIKTAALLRNRAEKIREEEIYAENIIA